jgi:hypothetical protein
MIGSISLAGTNLVINGSNGMAGNNYLVLTTTNLTLSLANWPVIATNQFGSDGSFNFTNSCNPSSPQKFYLLKLP